jgi:hypothetical protein
MMILIGNSNNGGIMNPMARLSYQIEHRRIGFRMINHPIHPSISPLRLVSMKRTFSETVTRFADKIESGLE